MQNQWTISSFEQKIHTTYVNIHAYIKHTDTEEYKRLGNLILESNVILSPKSSHLRRDWNTKHNTNTQLSETV